jgi:hypothetical protein
MKALVGLKTMDFAFLLVPLAAGILFGYLLRGNRKVNLGKVTLGTILVLIFSLGFSIGSNNDLLNSMPSVGLSAVLIASLAIVFSVVLVKIARRTAGLD